MFCQWCGSLGDDGLDCEHCIDNKGVNMRDYLEIGPSPAGENCAQLGSPDYDRKSRIECKAYMHQLERLFPDGVFTVKTFNHDYGSYREVVAYFDDSDSPMTNAAFAAEANSPEFWDEAATEELIELFGGGVHEYA